MHTLDGLLKFVPNKLVLGSMPLPQSFTHIKRRFDKDNS